MTGHDQSPAEVLPSHDQSAETAVTVHGSVVNENDLLTVAEVTRRFDISESTLRRLLASKTLEAVQRKGPKGNYWLIPPAALGVLGYRPKPTEPAAEVAPAEQLEALQATLEAERVAHADEMARVHETAATIREADSKAHAAEMARLTSSLEYERQLREAAEGKATLAEDTARIAATLAASTHQELERTRSRLLELEAGPKSGRWWKRSKKQAPETPPGA